MQQVIVPTSSKHTRKLVVRAALAMVVILLAPILALALRWPLSRQAVLKELEDESQSRVEVGAFHGTYFPRPGLRARARHFSAQFETWITNAHYRSKAKN
jgi:hypothetical protein